MIPIFVYGTLRKGFLNYEKILEGNLDKVLSAHIDGYDMFAIDYFPGIIKGKGAVTGEVIFIEPKKYMQILKELDQLEGYNPSRKSKSLFHREIQKVQLDSGEVIDAYVYVYNTKNGEQHGKIGSGDWSDYKVKSE